MAHPLPFQAPLPGTRQFGKGMLLSSVGWSVYLSCATVYCLAHQVFVLYNSSIDLVASLRWAVVEWGAWWALTPMMFAALDRTGARRRAPLYFAAIASGAVVLSLAYRLGLDFGPHDNSLAERIVYFFPRYMVASILVLFGWHIFLRRKVAVENTADMPGHPPEVPAAPQINTLRVSKGVDECLLEISEIDSFSAAGNYVDIMAGREAYLLRATLKQIEESVPASLFVRTHRSHIVRIQAVERIRVGVNGCGTVDLKGGQSVKLSKTYHALLKQRFALLPQVSEAGQAR